MSETAWAELKRLCEQWDAQLKADLGASGPMREAEYMSIEGERRGLRSVIDQMNAMERTAKPEDGAA